MKAVEGYVRADLVVIGDTAQSPEGGGSEAPEGEETPEGGEGENPEGGEAPEGGETAEPQPKWNSALTKTKGNILYLSALMKKWRRQHQRNPDEAERGFKCGGGCQ